jgi:UDP-N-acetylmuramate--alanine ligase
MLSGGLVNNFASADFAGNFRHGNGKFFIYEADESDKSLLAFNPDYSLILNIGNDHYPIEELTDVFSKFIRSTSKGTVLEESVAEHVGNIDGGKIKYSVFGSSLKCDWQLLSYKTEDKVPTAIIENKFGGEKIKLALPSPGMHMAMNAVSVLATLDILGLYSPDCHKHISSFGGVWRRFNIKGKLSSGALVIDDYAHNPEKISSCIRTAKEITAGRIFAVFQPHGFGPLKFMKDNLFKELEKIISKEDKFIFLPVFYAGGTTSFSPTSEEVVSEFDPKAEGSFLFFKTRDHLEKYLKTETCADDTVAVMGARDNSLSTWTEEILK